MTITRGPTRTRAAWTESAVLFELSTSETPMSTAQLRASVHPTTHPDPTDRELLVALRRLVLRGQIVRAGGGPRDACHWTVPTAAPA